MERSGRVAVLAHCLLNVNTKVHGIAIYRAVHPMVRELLADDIGVIQLPCPEVAYLGMTRWGMTREQYDVAAYRRHCVELLGPTVDTLEALTRDECAITGIWGLDGSPSCGVEQTCAGYEGGDMDRLTGPPEWRTVDGEGVFMSVLRSLLSGRGLGVPFYGVPEAG